MPMPAWPSLVASPSRITCPAFNAGVGWEGRCFWEGCMRCLATNVWRPLIFLRHFQGQGGAVYGQIFLLRPLASTDWLLHQPPVLAFFGSVGCLFDWDSPSWAFATVWAVPLWGCLCALPWWPPARLRFPLKCTLAEAVQAFPDVSELLVCPPAHYDNAFSFASFTGSVFVACATAWEQERSKEHLLISNKPSVHDGGSYQAYQLFAETWKHYAINMYGLWRCPTWDANQGWFASDQSWQLFSFGLSFGRVIECSNFAIACVSCLFLLYSKLTDNWVELFQRFLQTLSLIFPDGTSKFSSQTCNLINKDCNTRH